MNEVCRSFGAEDTYGARWAPRVETDHHYVVQHDIRLADSDRQAIGDLLQANVRSLDGSRWVFAETLDQEAPVGIDERVVDGGPAEVDARDDLHTKLPGCRVLRLASGR